MFLILCLFLPAVFCSQPFEELWQQAGCSNEGILSPSTLPAFWKRRNDQQHILQVIQNGVNKKDSLSLLTCHGSDSIYLNPERGNDKTIHLLWECYDKTETCKIPFVLMLCVKTLRQVHPKAKIILWSNSVDNVHDPSLELRRYDWETFFGDLPENVLNAAKTMQGFFATHQNSRSHFSDLFRAVVLYKFGGYYSDLDSLWLRDIDLVSDAPSWVPITPSWQELDEADRINVNGKTYFLEGGMMKMEKGSPFLKAVLDNFPEYTAEVVECWACVGPRLLTQTYNQLQKTDSESLPEFVDSQIVYGVPHYRNYFSNMFKEFDPDVWFEFVDSDTVAAHLFTSSLQPAIEDSSILSFLFSVGGIANVATEDSASWRASVNERRNLLSSLYYINDETMGSAQIGGGSVIYWVGELGPVEATVDLAEVNDENIATLRNIFYENYPPVVLSGVVVQQIDDNTVHVTVNEPDYYAVTTQSVQVGIALAMDPLQATITDMVIPTIGGGRASLEAECITGTALESSSALSTISTSMASQIGIDEEDLDVTTTFATTAGAFCIFTSSLTIAEKVSVVESALATSLGMSMDSITVEDPNAIGNMLFSVTTGSFDDAFAVDSSIGSSATEATFNSILPSDSDSCTLLTGTDNIVSTTYVIADTTGTTSTALSADVSSAQSAIEVVEGCTVSSTSSYVYGAQAVGSCDLLEECTADYQEILDEQNAALGLVKGSEVSAINQWWLDRFAEYPVPNFEQVRQYNGFFVIPCDSCSDEDMYVNTCVQFNEDMQGECDSSVGWCSGEAVYGWSGQQSAALISAMEMPQKHHPYCPWGCQKLNDWWLEELDSRLSDELKPDLDSLCVQDNKYYLYPDPQTKMDTCVGYNDYHLTQCPLSSYVFCPSTDDGLITYGWIGQQARALVQALSTSLKRHPSCS